MLQNFTDDDYYFAATFEEKMRKEHEKHKLDTVNSLLTKQRRDDDSASENDDDDDDNDADIESVDSNYVYNYNNDSSHRVHFPEFCILLLIRLGKIDKHKIHDLKDLFHALDSENKGYVLKKDFIEKNFFDVNEKDDLTSCKSPKDRYKLVNPLGRRREDLSRDDSISEKKSLLNEKEKKQNSKVTDLELTALQVQAPYGTNSNKKKGAKPCCVKI